MIILKGGQGNSQGHEVKLSIRLKGIVTIKQLENDQSSI